MLNSEDLLITFPSVEDKVDFMEWFNGVGFNQYLRTSIETSVTCVSTFEFGEMPSYGDYQDIRNGNIELQ